VIRNPRWLSWSLIVRHIFHNFFQEDCMWNDQTYCRRIWRCVATFYTDLESKMATGTMASYWPRHFGHFFYCTNMYKNKNKNKNFLLPIKVPQGANNLMQWLKWLEKYKDTCKHTKKNRKKKQENIFMFSDCTARSEPIKYHHKSIHI
jgi:hypothetical protein